MKKKTNKKLRLNKERISELSMQNMGSIKGGESNLFDNCWHITYAPGCSVVTCLGEVTVILCSIAPDPKTNPFFC